MANGKKSWPEQYAMFAFMVFCTLGSWVYFRQSIYPLAKVAQVAELQTQVKQSDAKTAAVVNQVKKQSSQAAGSAEAAMVAAAEAQKSAELAEMAARRRFNSEPTKVQIQDLFIRSSHNRADISRMQKELDDLKTQRR